MKTVSTDFDAAYWQARYATGRDGWDAHAITPPLRAYFDQLDVAAQPRILIPGAGRAYEAEYLHQLGFRQVFVADIAPEALAALAARVPDFPKEHLLLANFFALPNDPPYDLIVEQTFFCALNPDVAPGLCPAVRPPAAPRRHAHGPAVRYRFRAGAGAALRRQQGGVPCLFCAVF